MIAYAAQGCNTGTNFTGDPPIRSVLGDLFDALNSSNDLIVDIEAGGPSQEIALVLDVDEIHAKRAIDLGMSYARIYSQPIERSSATIHVRSLLTNRLLIDEAMKCLSCS
ncbi:MAG: hypothetical protein HQ492_04145 [Woeseiaceae bacterium]|nr:hypothetical protein [Woeseiaceae bacterium]